MQNAQTVGMLGKRNARLVAGEVFRILFTALVIILQWVVITGRGSEKIILKSLRCRSKNQLEILGNIIISLALLPVVVVGRLVWFGYLIGKGRKLENKEVN